MGSGPGLGENNMSGFRQAEFEMPQHQQMEKSSHCNYYLLNADCEPDILLSDLRALSHLTLSHPIGTRS